MSQKQKSNVLFTNEHAGGIKLHGPDGLIDQGYVNPEQHPQYFKNVGARNAAARILDRELTQAKMTERNVDALLLANSLTEFIDAQDATAAVASYSRQDVPGTMSESGVVMVPAEVDQLRNYQV